MKTNAFAYARAGSLAEARQLYAEAGEGARYLAGGQSLMAALNFRLDEPSVLIDLGGIAALRGISRQGEVIRIGALTCHAEVLVDPLITAHLPLIAQAMPHVAHPAIRNRGTFGGSVALADPAAEMPACCLALSAQMVIEGDGGTRRVPADGFFRGLYETAMAPGEVLVAVEIPLPEGRARHGFGELARRHGDYAMAGVALMLGPDRAWARVAFFGLSDRAVRSAAAEASIVAGSDPYAVATDGLDIYPDLNADEATKRHYAAVLLRRALAELTETGAAA